ncbi:uncharacterized protein MELLADRAFT_54777 [Melampsora larici-populina 98AG31]|uniref:Cytosol aminopeptidase domain-containing protein n=1 Tax=Melampsora larici-populina (strain 98AG31 / pathotype 3-4-7) TaxID=747676 RepID=F4R618_MELLP|nr:uncharacterized protein MELLADRAFT_54777 [Melampsora larici-populina 98AG31]EGG12142.1 hypothetical protein MELLADRAFT_54777 [Melampsora larici-populina 98AG31]
MSTTSSKPIAILAIKPDGTPFQSNLSSSSSSSPHINSIHQNWSHSNPKGKPFETRIFYGPDSLTAAIGLGKIPEGISDIEKAEKTRKLSAIGAKSIREHATEVLVDPVWSSHAAAVGATLSTFSYTAKTKKDALEKTKPVIYKPLNDQPIQLSNEKASDKLIELNWSSGLIFGRAQNLARELMETPANMMTPTAFCDRIKKEFEGISNVEIHVRDREWAEAKGMRSFLSVARGSNEPCKFLEVHYKGSSGSGAFQPSVAFVGKGITFDSGGISLKPGAGMKLMRADMGGAACVNSAAWAIAKLEIPIDLIVCTPLTENMPSGHATKPGDIIYAMNGKSIEVDNTDAEGRLVLADALYYASSVYKPRTVIDCATLTGAMMIALGETFSGVFSTSDKLWNDLDAAGKAEHDRFWRMPFDDTYMGQIDGTNADLCNTGGRTAGSCTAAIFLREFVDGLACNATGTEAQEKPTEDTVAYAHLDIAGSMECTKPEGYNLKGMSGRPVRALIEYIRQEAAGRA